MNRWIVYPTGVPLLDGGDVYMFYLQLASEIDPAINAQWLTWDKRIFLPRLRLQIRRLLLIAKYIHKRLAQDGREIRFATCISQKNRFLRHCLSATYSPRIFVRSWWFPFLIDAMARCVRDRCGWRVYRRFFTKNRIGHVRQLPVFHDTIRHGRKGVVSASAPRCGERALAKKELHQHTYKYPPCTVTQGADWRENVPETPVTTMFTICMPYRDDITKHNFLLSTSLTPATFSPRKDCWHTMRGN